MDGFWRGFLLSTLALRRHFTDALHEVLLVQLRLREDLRGFDLLQIVFES